MYSLKSDLGQHDGWIGQNDAYINIGTKIEKPKLDLGLFTTRISAWIGILFWL